VRVLDFENISISGATFTASVWKLELRPWGTTYPRNTQFYWVPAVRETVAFNFNNSDYAIESSYAGYFYSTGPGYDMQVDEFVAIVEDETSWIYYDNNKWFPMQTDAHNENDIHTEIPVCGAPTDSTIDPPWNETIPNPYSTITTAINPGGKLISALNVYSPNVVNALANETANAIDDIVIQQNPVDVIGGTGISVIESPPNTFVITNTGIGSTTNIVAGTGISVVESPTDTFTITNTAPSPANVALLSGPAQTFTNDNTFVGNTNIVGPSTTFDGAITQLAAGRTFLNNGTFAGGTAAFTTYQNLPVDDILAGTGISIAESPAGTFTITNTGVPGPPGPAGGSNPSGGVLYRRTSGNWNRITQFGNVIFALAASGTDPNGFACINIFPDMDNGNTFYRSAVIFARELTQTGFTQTTPNTYTPSTPANTGWRAFVAADFINFSAVDFINEFSTKLSTYPTTIGDMEFWLYYY
jgi:hypothetical protein